MERRLLKRSREDSEHVELSESSHRRRGEGATPTGFGSGPAGRRHLLFADTARGAYDQVGPSSVVSDARASGLFPLKLNVESLYKEIEQQQDTLVQQHEVYDQAGPSRQRDAQLDTEDSKILEHYTEYIFSDEKWNHFINSIEFGQKEFFSGLVSHFPIETIAEQARKDQHDAGKSDHLRSPDQGEQGQATLPQRHEGHDQADTTIPREIQLASTLIEQYGSKMSPCYSIRPEGDIRSEIYHNKLSEEEYKRASKYVDETCTDKNNKSDINKIYNIKTSLRNTYSYTWNKRRR